MQPGDLLFSKGPGHMGMYAGNGKTVHAPWAGDIIKEVDLDGGADRGQTGEVAVVRWRSGRRRRRGRRWSWPSSGRRRTSATTRWGS
ncbi:NlpC/P60 family protein [Streptosporangium amethystogenes]|uniref:NlpC/P60 family protein n=1 Tax=Streptosporangium amethystogenes TaxID=2002 RepID=UPI0037B046EE